MAAWALSPPESVALTTKVLLPASDAPGVPLSAPAAEIESHAGPLISAKRLLSPGFGFTACDAIEAEIAWLSFTVAPVNGFDTKEGATGLTTEISIVAVAVKPFVSARLTTNEFVPMFAF